MEKRETFLKICWKFLATATILIVVFWGFKYRVKASEESIMVTEYNFVSGQTKEFEFIGDNSVPEVHPGFAGTDSILQGESINARNVIGSEGRKIVNSRAVPYRRIGPLSVSFDDFGTVTGTGFLISPDTVLTAASCVYSLDTGRTAQSVVFSPGAGNGETPYGNIEVIAMRIPANYKKQSKPGTFYNWAVLKLATPIGNQCGYFGLKNNVFGDSGADMGTWEISGYPGQGIGGGPGNFYGSQVSSKGNVRLSSNNDFTLKYKIDTTKGQEGSPIFEMGPVDFIAGIHCVGGPNYNLGRFITTNLYKLIVSAF